MKKSVLAITFVIVIALVMVAACGSKTGRNVAVPSGKTIKSVTVGNLSPTLSNSKAEMNDATTLTTTGTPGVYRGQVNIEVAGEWQGQLAYEGPVGSGKTTFTVT